MQKEAILFNADTDWAHHCHPHLHSNCAQTFHNQASFALSTQVPPPSLQALKPDVMFTHGMDSSLLGEGGEAEASGQLSAVKATGSSGELDPKNAVRLLGCFTPSIT